jgi:hypothetical protein
MGKVSEQNLVLHIQMSKVREENFVLHIQVRKVGEENFVPYRWGNWDNGTSYFRYQRVE